MDAPNEPNSSSTESLFSFPRSSDTSILLRLELDKGICLTFNNERFIPLDHIQRTLSPKAVELDLRSHSSNLSEETIENAVKSVCNSAEADMCLFRDHVVGARSRLRVFATLVLIEATDKIADFIHAEIYDADLPLQENTSKSACFPESFKNWSTLLRRMFCEFQWLSISPFFSSSTCKQPTEESIPFFNIPDRVALPFKSCDNIFSDRQHVSKLEIFSGHHEFLQSHGQSKDAFILERPNYSRVLGGSEKFNIELHTWRRALVHDNTAHIQQIHAAFQHRGNVYLIQPHFKGSLVNLLESELHHPLLGRQLTWVAKQSHGIARSLEAIHQVIRDRQGVHAPRRYGTLQAEDILWFQEGEELELDKLKIARIDTLRKVHRSTSVFFPGFSGEYETYVPPELVAPLNMSTLRQDISNDGTTHALTELLRYRSVCPESDIWSLGCIFLDFATWCLSGCDGYEEFSQMRAEEMDQGCWYRSDHFFKFDESNYDPRKPPNSIHCFVLKTSVVDWLRRMKQSSCPPCLRDFIDFIQTDILVIDPAKRATSARVSSFLGELNDRCQADPAYCEYGEEPGDKGVINQDDGCQVSN